jgi:hypothetical protein
MAAFHQQESAPGRKAKCSMYPRVVHKGSDLRDMETHYAIQPRIIKGT